jgi:hypothetical protein
VTESSRSRIKASAALVAAFSCFLALSPGTKSQDLMDATGVTAAASSA